MGTGRPKAFDNVTSTSATEDITLTADKLDGCKRLVEWAKENSAYKRHFWGSNYIGL